MNEKTEVLFTTLEGDLRYLQSISLGKGYSTELQTGLLDYCSRERLARSLRENAVEIVKALNRVTKALESLKP